MLGNFQDFEAFPNILILLEFKNEDIKDIGRRVSRSSRLVNSRFYSGFAGQFLIFISLTLYFFLAQFVIVTTYIVKYLIFFT